MLDNVHYHGHNLSIAYDQAGTRYAKYGCGGQATTEASARLCVWVDGKLSFTAPTLTRLNCTLPQ